MLNVSKAQRSNIWYTLILNIGLNLHFKVKIVFQELWYKNTITIARNYLSYTFAEHPMTIKIVTLNIVG